MASETVAPELGEFHAPSDWASIEFISDLHLSERTPASVEAWSAFMRASRADAVFILGDLFEVWVGDDAREDAFESRCLEVLAACARQRVVGFMAGNRDFLVGRELLDACGVLPLADPTLLTAFGRRILLSHGDALCVADRPYQEFRRQVRGSHWQSNFLAQPLADRREQARHMRDASESLKAARPNTSDWIDVDDALCLEWLGAAGADALIHGHTHRPGQVALSASATRYVLSDWDLDSVTAPLRAQVLRLTLSGIERVDWSIDRAPRAKP